MSGFDPNEDSLILSEGADYVATFVERGVVWPAGTTAQIVFHELEDVGPFDATITLEGSITSNGQTVTGGMASFVIPKTSTGVATLPKGAKYRLMLTKEHTYCWFRGKVERQD
ncbi:hypothetical protein BJD66_gp25 [Gordonia phage Emalyn]|uniref:LtfC/p132/Gp6 beta-sandwich domain-containing protein n=1 Tax=Gordonia phage Emalyn TaxID=1821552 RepID=A0A142KBW1_9CAUD|nr:hypothetical protein BJD66_gp25 [Gordonia phage Emalyn]AMS03594.1 hypothetical protein SEA_EMALYN_25 [Gordonia phage Emalyn]